MRPEMFGDSYDFLKKTLIQTLAEGWMTHPMYFDPQPQEGFVRAHAAYLGVDLAVGDIDHRNAVKRVGMGCRRHLLLDPDTGVWARQRQPNGGWNKHLRVREVARIASAPERDNLLTLVFDQSYTRAKHDERRRLVLEKLRAIRDHHRQCQGQPRCRGPLHGAAYVTHAVFIWVSLNGDLVERAKRQMLERTQLPEWRGVTTADIGQDEDAE